MKEQNVGQDMRYYELLDQLVSAMTAAGEADVSQIEQILGEIARLFRLCKGVTRLYRSLDEEKEGGGETFCSFDIGEGESVAFQRVVTSGMAIATMTVYIQSGIRPLSSEERRRVELIMRLTLNFVCRNRMQRSIEDLAFFDYDGYRNTRSLQNHFMQVERTGRFVGLAVVRYNLRHFTVVNQELGREKANAVLRSHYKTVEELVGAEGIVCRLSGDDFVAVCRKERLEKLLANTDAADVTIKDKNGNILSFGTDARGKETVTARDANGKIVDTDGAVHSFVIGNLSPLGVKATGQVNVKADGQNVYIAGRSNEKGVFSPLNTGVITATYQDVRLYTREGIYNALPENGANQANVSARNLIAYGGDKDIGAKDKYLAVDLAGDLLSANADGSIYIRNLRPYSYLQVGSLYAGDTIALDSATGIRMSWDPRMFWASTAS